MMNILWVSFRDRNDDDDDDKRSNELNKEILSYYKTWTTKNFSLKRNSTKTETKTWTQLDSIRFNAIQLVSMIDHITFLAKLNLN